MAELINTSTAALDSGGISKSRLYSYTHPEDLLGLRNEAAQWAFGRALRREEIEELLSHEGCLVPLISSRQPLILQKDPRIALSRTPNGVTMETFGKVTTGKDEGRFAQVSYPTSRPASQRLCIELIETWPLGAVIDD